ncbi:MAG: hypothetical protein ACRC4U_14895, partial [Shewanella sp.]
MYARNGKHCAVCGRCSSRCPSVSAISELAKALIYKKITAPANARVDITPQTIDQRMLPSQCASPLRVELASEREINRNNT